MSFPRFHRCCAVLLVLAYLFIGSGLSRAVVWCVDEAGHSHIEFNPAGNCRLACEDDAPPATPDLPGLNAGLPDNLCQGVVLLSSQAKQSRVSSPVPPVILPDAPLPTSTVRLAALTPDRAPPRHQQLPPPLSLTALATVVLLN